MDSMFLGQLFGQAAAGQKPSLLWLVNKGLQRIGAPLVIRRWAIQDMTNDPQRINLWHLACQPLAYGVQGDLVEFGCFDGRTAVIFARVMEHYARDRHLHLYDNFKSEFYLKGACIEDVLQENFRAAGCVLPSIHAGDFSDTVPRDLPEQIAFGHIDCGTGGDVDTHKENVLFLLNHLYPRMSPGAICALMDYHDPELQNGSDFNPGVGLAVREFLADKPEKCCALWAAECAHGFFRKL